MEQLTRKQQRVYDYLVTFTEEHGYPPSVREIGEALDLKSPSTVHFHLKSLARLGVINRTLGKTRAIAIVEKQPKMPDNAVPFAPPAGQVPVVGNVAAGAPITAEECVEDYLAFDTNGLSGEHFALKVRGESMLHAGILPGDYVIVHQQQSFHNGDIVVALFEDEATVKTYRKKNGHLWLMPENPEYEPIDGDGCALLGKVVAVLRKYN